MQPSTSQQYCACVWLCVFALCMMWRQWRAVFHSWIKPGQRPRGLQVNVAYFKRLFLHGHSVSNAHAEESQQEKASGYGLRICLFFPKRHCVFLKSACSLSVCFPFSSVTSLSFCFLSFFQFLYPFSFISFSFISSIIVSISAHQWLADTYFHALLLFTSFPLCSDFPSLFFFSLFPSCLCSSLCTLPPYFMKAILACINDSDHWE